MVITDINADTAYAEASGRFQTILPEWRPRILPTHSSPSSCEKMTVQSERERATRRVEALVAARRIASRPLP